MLRKGQPGQILMEVIVAVAIIIFVSVSISLAIATSIKGVRLSLGKTAALFLSQETVEAVRALSLENWNNLDQLATSSANAYFATTSAGKWVHATGTESVTLNRIAYTRYFWTDDVYRSTSTGNIVSAGGAWDPSTKKLTTKLTWTEPGAGANEFSQVSYVSRYINDIYAQTDWSGGSQGEVVATTATTSFATSTNVSFGSTTGSIRLETL